MLTAHLWNFLGLTSAFSVLCPTVNLPAIFRWLLAAEAPVLCDTMKEGSWCGVGMTELATAEPRA